MHDELADFATAVSDVPELRSVLRNPQVDPRTKARILDELVGDADELVRNFLRLTAEKGRIGAIEEIVREFERLVAAEERRLNVELTTAYELSDEEAGQIVKQIEQASGRKVEATRSVDPGLIGGFIAEVGGTIYDGSIRQQLQTFRNSLTQD